MHGKPGMARKDLVRSSLAAMSTAVVISKKRHREVSRNSITTECADFQTVVESVLRPISARSSGGRGGETPSMNVMNLMVVALAGGVAELLLLAQGLKLVAPELKKPFPPRT